ncbi:Na+/H+ antiporter [Sphingomonas sp. AP4-R1]|uniref:Na+/H+ antiporter n=1 Tax=Sphingomonas sp. AP4-R1 TaxID=2735134 RepID=UPI00149364CB|nr:Na+/H+ antiporter [Sphingomonas sp. AP4-R1]QJU58793.1 Na+/H+ antiporter [Sphingomonas sp. AP4-R1]
MHPTELFELVVGMLVAILALHWIAERMGWPPSIALLIGGGAIAFIPGIPPVRLDPELVLVLFLPPLLMDGAWYTAIARFRRHFAGIMSLAVGAVLFTTAFVAVTAHWLMPSLPWAACAALGAIVAPPDAVSARAVLQQVQLPRRLSTLLEGESLLNDAAGLVLFRFAVAATMGGVFDPAVAAGQFLILALGGLAVGLAIGLLCVALARRVHDELSLVVMSALVGWIAYLTGEAVHVSGVIATVTTGLVLGWYQHVVFSAAVRVRGTSFWTVMVFLFEASVFMLIGFSLRDVLDRTGGVEAVLGGMAWPLLAIVIALTAARFVWVFGSDVVLRLLVAAGWSREAPLGTPNALVMSWAGMRGVVTLAVALTLPEAMPGRDFMLLAAFGVILVTVLVQGSTLGLVIRLAGVRQSEADAPPIDMIAAETMMLKAQLRAVEQLSHGPDGTLLHPRLLEQYSRRAHVSETYGGTPAERTIAIAEHFDVIIAAVAAGREELVRLHRANRIDDETLHSLERDLDLEELGAISAKA